jgi:hypothetical protein
MESHELFALADSNLGPPDLSLLSRKDYQPPVPSCMFLKELSVIDWLILVQNFRSFVKMCQGKDIFLSIIAQTRWFL